MMQILAIVIQFVFVIAIAPLAAGLVTFFKARLQGRKGASPFLPYVTFATMFKREMVISSATSWVFRFAPFAVLASSLGLALVLPVIFRGGLFAEMSDFMIVAGVLMFGSIFLVLGGLDTGSAFGGMGSSREMTITTLVEPTLIMIFVAFCFVTESFNIDGMLSHSVLASSPFLLLSIMGLVMLMLAENARYPVDNPATHLELTMVHEAMILEYSGPYLAMMEYASAIKLTVFAFLVGNFIFPAGLLVSSASLSAIAVGLVYAVLKIVIAMALLALLESVIVKMRFYRMQEYATVSFVAAFFGLVGAVSAKLMDFSVNYFSFFAALTVFFTVFLFGHIRARAVLRYYILSSLSIAVMAVSLAMSDSEDATHLLLFAISTFVVKVILVPMVISYAIKHYKMINQSQVFVKAASSYFLAAIILIVNFFLVGYIPLDHSSGTASILYASTALVMLGVVKMAIRRNIYSQIIGLLVLENGLALFTIATVKTLPIFMELGIFAVTIVSVIILSKLSTNIKELYSSTDTEELRNLID